MPTVIPMRGAACRAWHDRTSWTPMWSVCHWCTLPACWRSAPRWTCAMTLTQFAACGARYGAFGRTSLCVAHARHSQGIHLLRHLVSSANFDVSLLDGGQGESEFLPAPPFSVAKVVHAANHAIAHDPDAAAELFGTIARLLGDIASHPGQAIGRTVRKNALPLVQVGLCGVTCCAWALTAPSCLVDAAATIAPCPSTNRLCANGRRVCVHPCHGATARHRGHHWHAIAV